MNLLMQALKLSQQPHSKTADETHTQQAPHEASRILAPGTPSRPLEPEINLFQAIQPAPLGHSLKHQRNYQRVAAGIFLIATVTAAIHWLTQTPSAMSPTAQTLAAATRPHTAHPELNATAIGSTNQPASTRTAETNISPVDTAVPQPRATEAHQNEIAVSTSTGTTEIEQRLNNAYTAYQNGEHTAAWAQYLEVLAREEDNLDALLGLAAIAQQQEHNALALAYYQRALKFDPQNTAALASVSQYSGADSATKESQLKQLILKNPETVEPYFALGNLYASSGRWAEAHKAYSSAFAMSPDSSLIAFNLAVALDHLGQYRAAAKFYQQALNHSSPEGTEINRPLAHQRVAELNAMD